MKLKLNATLTQVKLFLRLVRFLYVNSLTIYSLFYSFFSFFGLLYCSGINIDTTMNAAFMVDKLNVAKSYVNITDHQTKTVYSVHLLSLVVYSPAPLVTFHHPPNLWQFVRTSLDTQRPCLIPDTYHYQRPVPYT